jgi:hypothetical protein
LNGGWPGQARPHDGSLGSRGNDAEKRSEEEFIYQPALPFVTPIEGADDAGLEPWGSRASDFGAPAEFVSCDPLEIAHNS